MSIANLIFTYVLVLLGAIATAGIYSEFRRRRFEPTPSEDRIFRCGRCGYVYTDDADLINPSGRIAAEPSSTHR